MCKESKPKNWDPFHRIFGRICVVGGVHYRRKLPNYKKNREDIETIKSEKKDFRESLESLITSKDPIPFFTKGEIKIVYKLSDFDWKDAAKFEKFQDWYMFNFNCSYDNSGELKRTYPELKFW